MKRRILKTSKILAVALTATAGCATAGHPSPNADVTVEPVRQEMPVRAAPANAPVQGAPSNELAQAEAPKPAAEPAVQPGAANAAAAAAPPPPDRPVSKAPSLESLAGELSVKKPEEIFAEVARFRPLCDSDGYPLVGNVVRKGGPMGYRPSMFCSDLRARGGK